MAQSFTDFEVLLVDDGSTDNSFEICVRFAREDSRVRAIRIQNSGVSHARNTGMFYATGKYYVFCDSDDFVEPDWILKLYSLAAGNSSLVICGYHIVDNRYNKGKGLYVVPSCTYCHRQDFFDIAIQTLFYAVWNKMYCAEIIKKYMLRFEEDTSVGEDAIFNLDYLRVADDVILLDKGCEYNYILRESDSLDNKYRKDLFKSYVRLYERILQAMLAFGTDMQQYGSTFYSIYLRMLIAALYNNMSPKSENTFWNRIKENSFLMQGPEFSKCLELADMSEYSSVFIRCLKSKSFLLVFVYKRLCGIKALAQKAIKRPNNKNVQTP